MNIFRVLTDHELALSHCDKSHEKPQVVVLNDGRLMKGSERRNTASWWQARPLIQPASPIKKSLAAYL